MGSGRGREAGKGASFSSGSLFMEASLEPRPNSFLSANRYGNSRPIWGKPFPVLANPFQFRLVPAPSDKTKRGARGNGVPVKKDEKPWRQSFGRASGTEGSSLKEREAP